MFTDISANRIENVLVFAKSWEDAVDILVTNHPESASAVIQSFVKESLIPSIQKSSKLREKISGEMLFVFIKF